MCKWIENYNLSYKLFKEAINKVGVCILERVRYDIGDIVKMKKSHPCGSNLWEITRTGIDFGMKCKGCGHFVMIPRVKFEKAVREIVEKKNQQV